MAQVKGGRKPKSRSQTAPPSQSFLRPLLFAALGLIIAGTIWYVVGARHTATTAYTDSAKAASPATPKKLHATDEAVKAAGDLYQAYLPLKAQTVATVGSRTDVEPANVQVVRASEVYFSSAFYNKLLADYMKQYQQSGTVSSDEVACVPAATYQSAVLASSGRGKAVVNVTLMQDDGSTKVVPVTIDLATLKASGVAC